MHNKEFDDIIFENRNKDYGAYQLRKKHSNYNLIGFLIGSIVIVLMFAMPKIVEYLSGDQNEKIQIETKREIRYSELAAPPPIEVERPPEPVKMPPKPKKVVKYLPPVAKPDKEVLDEEIVPTQEELSEATASEVTITESDTIVYEDVPTTDTEVVIEEPFTVVEVMPQFPGGNSALLKYLSDNIVYPRQAIELEIEGRVYISFVVSTSGEVTNPEVLRGIGGGCDEEALRVVNKMPKWIAGQQSGRYVPVRYVLPVSFQLQY